MTCLAIDPGISSGWAFFKDDGELIICYGGNPPILRFGPITTTVIEIPKIYPRRKSKGDPNDLITLAIQAGQFKERMETRGSKVILLLPHEWKGQLDKDVCHSRYWPTLSKAEQSIVKAQGKGLSEKAQGDMLDAVCLGKFMFRDKGKKL